MGDAQRLSTAATPAVEQADLAPDVAAQLADPVRQICDTGDVQKIAAFLATYGGDPAPVMTYLQQKHGNDFCAQLTAEQKKTSTPSAWQKLKSEGKLRLFEKNKDATPAAENQNETKEEGKDGSFVDKNGDGIDDRIATFDTTKTAALRDKATALAGTSERDLGSYSTSKNAKLLDKSTQVDHALGQAQIGGKVGEGTVDGTGTAKLNAAEGLTVGGNANANAHLVGTTVAISSKPFTHELFGESVTAQFHAGVSAASFAEAKGNVGLNVAWTGLGARADLQGVAHGTTELTAAATLSWNKKSPDSYAQKLVQTGTWRNVLSRYLPGWALKALPDSRVQGWVTSLIELVISGGEGDQLVLGASTSATARGSLGLPQLSFRGGAIAVHPGAGLSFGGAHADFDLQMGLDPGMEMLTMLAFGGAGTLFTKLAPSFSIGKFLERKLDASLDKGHDTEGGKDAKDGEHAGESGGENSFASKMAALRDKAGALDGTHSAAWNKGNKFNGDDVKAEGHDFSLTRDKAGTQTHTGDAARTHHDEQTQRMQDAEAAKKPGKLEKLADKLGDAKVTVAHTNQSYSKTAIDKKTHNFDVAGAQGELSGRALELQASGTAAAQVGAKGMSIGGNANASAYLMGAQVHIATPELPFTVFGEQLKGKVEVSADAGAFAQVQGNVGLDVGWHGGGLQADLSGFAGVKAGLTASGALTWSRKPTSFYTDQIVQTGAWKTLFGSWLPQWVLNRAPDKYVKSWITQLIEMLVHGNGDALVLGAVARGEGSAGIGAAGSFSAKFQGGVLHCHGRGGITLGLGAGAAADLSLGVTDGMAMLGVMALRGGTELFHMLQPSMNMMAYLKPLFAQMKNRELPEPKRG